MTCLPGNLVYTYFCVGVISRNIKPDMIRYGRHSPGGRKKHCLQFPKRCPFMGLVLCTYCKLSAIPVQPGKKEVQILCQRDASCGMIVHCTAFYPIVPILELLFSQNRRDIIHSRNYD